jgi:lactoylglutathione lyase
VLTYFDKDMNMNNTANTPSRILYTMVRVSDLDRSIAFYRDALGMSEMRRETFSTARFTLVFMGYSGISNGATIELTYNWDAGDYTHGTGYGHVALEVDDIYAACTRLTEMGVEITRAPGPMKMAVDETGEREVIAFLKDPDGYNIELIEAAKH